MGSRAQQPDAGKLFEPPSPSGTPIGKRLILIRSNGRCAVFFGPTAIHVFDAHDPAAGTVCIAMLANSKLASHTDIATAFGCHRNTVSRIASGVELNGMAAVVPRKRGPKGPTKVTDEVLEAIDVASGKRPAEVVRLVAQTTGVKLSYRHVRRLMAEGRPAQQELREPGDAMQLSQILEEPTLDDPAPSDHTRVDESFEPPAIPPQRARGRYMGCALYYPALAATGLVETARKVFSLPRSERFGVRAVMLTLFFLTLLRKPTVESAKHLSRREFGALIGAGRAPAVKTLRRKLMELVSQQRTGAFGELLSRLWVERALVATAYLYVDGHMKAYTGKRKLKEMWNSQRRMPLPGVMTYFASDIKGRPLLFVTEQAPSLAKAMPKVIGAITAALGERAFTVVFDRGGYDGKLFSYLDRHGIGFVTYQRGDPRLDPARFSRRETRFEGKRKRFSIAEDEAKVSGTGPWRRIVIKTKDGHQTPILTNLDSSEAGAARIACLMFARWRQENFFKYMSEHHGLDQLVGHGYQGADPEQMVPNPARKKADRDIAKLRNKARQLTAALGDALLDEPRGGSRSAHGLKIAQKGAVKELRIVEAEIEELVVARKAMPKHVPLAQSGKTCEVLRLEHKAIVDRVKIAAYNAEEWMLDRLLRHYDNANDVRDLLRSFAESPGEIRRTPQGIEVKLDPPDTPRHRRALRALCEDLNAVGATFPGTDLPVVYRVAMHHSEAAA